MIAELPLANAENSGSPKPGFRETLMDCVKQFDPDNLDEFDNGGLYRLSGWFLSERRSKLVPGCMAKHGYIPMRDGQMILPKG